MKYFLVTVVVLLHLPVFSQRFFFQAYSTSEGLAQSQVTSISQDSVGYLWIATLGGISKYNGNTFKNYSTDNGLLNNRTNVIKWIDSKLYAGHQGGISIIENDKIRTVSLGKDFQQLNVTDIVHFKGKIIVATNGEGLYQLKNNKLQPFSLLQHDNLFVRDLLEWEGDLYIATRGGVVRTNDLKSVDDFLTDKIIIISSMAL
jgi:ligand-binding sensor domain-containing protein